MEAREYLKKIKDDGWYLHDTDGPTRQYVHKQHGGFLTICAKHNHTLGPDTAAAGLKAANVDIQGVPVVVVETTASGASAFSPDLPGVVATGDDEADTRARMSEAVALHRRALAGEAPEV
jgi:predicted RNA binding protein YcfA (HicA-like mRNA interferase family)/predicted RNase H-like HicB family nuclease